MCIDLYAYLVGEFSKTILPQLYLFPQTSVLGGCYQDWLGRFSVCPTSRDEKDLCQF